MYDRVAQELKLVEGEFGPLECSPSLDWFVIKRLALSTGWNKPETAVLVLIPAGYPTIPPDNFYTDADLRLSTGVAPGNSSPNQTVAGRPLLLFSFHIEAGGWCPGAGAADGHNLLTFVHGIRHRLAEAS